MATTSRTANVVTTCIAAALCASPSAFADQQDVRPARQLTAFQRLTDMVPERVAAYRRTLNEVGGTPQESPVLYFQSTYAAPEFSLLPQDRARLFAEDDTIIMSPGMTGRDLWAEEEFLIAGREDDFEDAADKWVTRAVKGSDGAAARRGNRMAPKFGWDGGPLAGFRRGPISVMGGQDQWSVRWSHKMDRPGWVARVGIGVEDGEERAAFTIGRSLFQARTGRK